MKTSKNYLFYVKLYDKNNSSLIKGVLQKYNLSNDKSLVVFFNEPKDYNPSKDKGISYYSLLELLRKNITNRIKEYYGHFDYDIPFDFKVYYCRVNSKRCPIKINMSSLRKLKKEHKSTNMYKCIYCDFV